MGANFCLSGDVHFPGGKCKSTGEIGEVEGGRERKRERGRGRRKDREEGVGGREGDRGGTGSRRD